MLPIQNFTIDLACPIHLPNSFPHPSNFNHHRNMFVSVLLILPIPWNLGRTSFCKALLVKGEQYVAPQLPFKINVKAFTKSCSYICVDSVDTITSSKWLYKVGVTNKIILPIFTHIRNPGRVMTLNYPV